MMPESADICAAAISTGARYSSCEHCFSALLIHCSNLYYHEFQGPLAKKLAQVSGLQRTFFCNSGTEAMEGALKMARAHGNKIDSAKIEIISVENSFHGRTLGALPITGQPKYRKDFEPLLAGVKFVPKGDADALEAAVSERTAGIVLELIQGEGGIRPGLLAFAYVGNAAYMLVGAVGLGMSGAVVADREQYGMLKYLRVSPAGLRAYLTGRGLAGGAEGLLGALLTLGIGALLPIGVGEALSWGQVELSSRPLTSLLWSEDCSVSTVMVPEGTVARRTPAASSSSMTSALPGT